LSFGPSPGSIDWPSSSDVGSLSGRSSVSGLSSIPLRYPPERNSNVPGAVREGMGHAGTVDRMDAEPEDGQRLATEARDRVRFEEDALALSDQVYRVARHLASSREDADELMQETYARAFRSWRSFTPGTNMRAWLLRILTNLNIDRGRRQQRAPQMTPLEANDYFLYDKLAENGDGISDEEQVVERLSQDDIVTALSAVPHDFRDVLVLVDLGDFSYADAAQILDIPVGTVMSRLHRGRRILKRELAESALEEAT
jgi:RNA polymerase sigma-70 factor, ECF subfamily